jgi:TolB-like protein/Flp pilus assembly protein TadD
VTKGSEFAGRALDPATRLDSWKEIANYLKRGIRTVQRWERDERLPVYRLQHEKLGSVYAFAPQLNAWWTSRGQQLGAVEPDALRSIAVLPFRDLSREKDQEYFCEGVAEEILGALSRIQGFQVASRLAAFRFRGNDVDPREAGRKLGVGAVLDGSVRKAGDRFRVAVQLTDTGSGMQIWSGTYDRDLDDIFRVQEEIAASVAHALEVTLSVQERADLGQPAARDIEAYDYYLRGRKYYFQYGAQDVQFAMQLFQRAVERDPSYAAAQAGIADCWSYHYLNVERSPFCLEKAGEASRQAVELAPRSAQAQASRALALSLTAHDVEAEEAFQRALALDPRLFEAHYFYARHCFVHGRLEKAVELYESALRVRPEDFQAPLLMAQIYVDLGKPEEASRSRLRGIRNAELHLELNPDDVRAIYMAANGMAALGQRARALEWAARAVNLRPHDPMLVYNIACIYSLAGEIEAALETLESAFNLGLRHKGWYEHDSNLDPLRAEPRFQAIRQQL